MTLETLETTYSLVRSCFIIAMSTFCGDPYYPPCTGCSGCHGWLQSEDTIGVDADTAPVHMEEAPAGQVQPTVETPEYDPVEDGSEEDTVWTDVHVDDSATVLEVDAPEGPEPIVDHEAENLFGDDASLDLESEHEHYDAGDSEVDASEDHESGHDYDHANDSDAEAAEDSQAEDDTMDLDEEEEESGEHSESDTDAPEIVPTPTHTRRVIIRRQIGRASCRERVLRLV